jgi:hypothetical protein
MKTTSRLERERETLVTLIRLYCHGQGHTGKTPCPGCAELLEYALERLARCPFGGSKPTCLHCTVHCYTSSMHGRVREVMRYSGPRMLWRHPWLTLMHAWEGWRSKHFPGKKTVKRKG